MKKRRGSMERLIKVGKLDYKSADKVKFSRLGIGFEKLDRGVFDPNKAYDKVAKLGVKKIRIQSGWMRSEKEEGVYDFGWLDLIVDNLISRGLEPWICLCYGNPIYTDLAKPVFGAVGCPPISTERERAAWIRYAEATVAHFKGRVDLYEVWNEPDLPYSWRHCEDEEFDEEKRLANAVEYGNFACETAQAVKRADESAKVIGFAIANAKNLTYVDTVMSTGLYKYIDFVSFHLYSCRDNERAGIIEALTRLVQSYRSDLKLIQGEGGAQSRSDGNGAMKGYAWTREKQTKYLLRTLICDIFMGLEFTSYFSTMDMIEALRGRISDKASYLDYGYFGVLGAEFDENGVATGEYREKPSYYALSTLASLFSGNARADGMIFKTVVLDSKRVGGSDCGASTLRFYPFKLDDESSLLCYLNGTDILTTSYEGTVSLAACFPIGIYAEDNGMTVDADTKYTLTKSFEEAPQTFEAWIYVPVGYGRAGVIIGNYAGSTACVNFEITTNGRQRA